MKLLLGGLTGGLGKTDLIACGKSGEEGPLHREESAVVLEILADLIEGHGIAGRGIEAVVEGHRVEGQRGQTLGAGSAEAGLGGLDAGDLGERFRNVAEGLVTGEPPGVDGKLTPEPVMAPDWKTNPVYISFALRATAGTMATYVFMSLTAWNGIHTCMVTCVVTALSLRHAQIRKQNLRLAGAVLGALAGVGALLFILSQHQSLLTLLLILGPLTYLAAWVCTGPLRIGYAGWQVALAVYYVLLADPHITIKLEPIRDRWIGIFVGILAMRAAFVWLAPSRPAPLTPPAQAAVSRVRGKIPVGP